MILHIARLGLSRTYALAAGGQPIEVTATFISSIAPAPA